MIAILKFLTILATALFGMFGSLVDFRDKSGKITRNGWIGLTGVIVAGISAGVLQVYSDLTEEKSTLTILEQNSALLTEVSRTVYPLPGLTVSYFLRPDWDSDGFKQYFAEFERESVSGQKFGNVTLPPQETAFGTFPFPPHDENLLLTHTICDVDIELLFFRDPIDPTSFEYDIRRVGEDLRIKVSNPCEFDKYFAGTRAVTATGKYFWDYGLLNGKLQWLDLEIRPIEIDSTSNQWRGNSRITSLYDLLGSQLIIQLGASGIPTDTQLTKDDIQRHRKSIALADLIIRLRNGIVMRFDQENLILIAENDQFRAYLFLFPNTMQELIEATFYDQFKKVKIYGETAD